ncbi:hypothetical protein [Kitasatospora sp. NPDC002040]|uniref:hypothetical protein n=1 Tax=Kitasatospora sp. NPDC002040 TaxID=3154661 RepID=UPI00331F273E
MRDIAVAIGETPSDRRIETTRSPTPTGVTIGDGYNLQLYACPVAPQHPHTASVQ